MIRFFLIFIGLACVSCSSGKFYNGIEKLNIEGYDGKVDESKKYSRILLKNMNTELSSSEHLILLYLPPKTLNYTKPYSGIVYDVSKNIYYGVSGYDINEMSYSKLDLNSQENAYYKFILNNYRDRNLAELRSLGELSELENVFIKEIIFDVNLKTKNDYYFIYNHIIDIE